MTHNVISKVRCLPPSKKDTPMKNYKHIFYISNRTHCLKNDVGNTLFGTIYDFDNIDLVNNSKIANYIYQKSNKGTNIYRGIVSLSEQDAIEQGFTDRTSWENMINESIEKIAQKLNIKFCNLEWVATVHYKKGNPHLHYMIWDREQKIKNPFITISTQYKIRNILKRSIYKDYYIEIINNKNESKKDLRNEQLKQEFKAIDKNYCRSKIAYINLDKKLVKELKEDLKIIKASLPTKGRLNYAFMPDSTKQLLDNFIDKLIENNFDCKRCYENYIKSWEKIAEFYDNYYYGEVVSNANIEAHKILGNQLLRYFKEEQYLHYSIEQILQDLYYVLSQSEEREKSFLQRYVFNKDLSIYAKKEYVFKHKFSNYIERDI